MAIAQPKELASSARPGARGVRVLNRDIAQELQGPEGLPRALRRIEELLDEEPVAVEVALVVVVIERAPTRSAPAVVAAAGRAS